MAPQIWTLFTPPPSPVRSGFPSSTFDYFCGSAQMWLEQATKKSKPTPARAYFPKILDEKIPNAILGQFFHSPMIHGQIGTGGNGFAYFISPTLRGSIYFPASSFLDLDFGNRSIKSVECVDSGGKKSGGHKKSTLKPTQRIFFVAAGLRSGYRRRILTECV